MDSGYGHRLEGFRLKADGRSVWSIWFVWFIWLNQIDPMTRQTRQTCFRPEPLQPIVFNLLSEVCTDLRNGFRPTNFPDHSTAHTIFRHIEIVTTLQVKPIARTLIQIPAKP